jgi:hypothetical protein
VVTVKRSIRQSVEGIMADDLVTVATYPFSGSAEVVRMRLEDETVSINWLFGNAVGWVKPQVPQ